ncbi:hypothetical protein ACFLSW_03260 [Candidatus Bipolaricaulota bacterium]
MNVTLYIPDSLHQRLEQHRSQINASAILQHALERELSSLEAASGLGADEMDVAVQRLLAEKEMLEGRSREHGQAEGLKWALSAPYEQLARVALGYRRSKKKIRGHPIEAAQLLKRACAATWESIDKPEKSAPMVEKGAFCLGFLDGVMRVWERLQQEAPAS